MWLMQNGLANPDNAGAASSNYLQLFGLTALAYMWSLMAKAELQEATMWLMQNGLANPDNAGAASTDYLHLFGLTALGYMWAMQAKAAMAGDTADPFLARKLAVARYYMARVLPETASRLAKLTTGADLLMKLPAEAF